MNDTFGWLNVQRIGEELADRHPGLNPYTVNFVELKQLVAKLPGFAPEANHPVNERILEEIQRVWAGERDEDEDEDDDENN